MSFTQQYEVSPLTFDDFKKKNLVDLLVGIRNYRRVNWGKVPIMEKYCHCSKQCFIKRYSKYGGNPIDAFKLIKRVEELPRGKLIKDFISKEDLSELEKNLEYIN